MAIPSALHALQTLERRTDLFHRNRHPLVQFELWQQANSVSKSYKDVIPSAVLRC